MAACVGLPYSKFNNDNNNNNAPRKEIAFSILFCTWCKVCVPCVSHGLNVAMDKSGKCETYFKKSYRGPNVGKSFPMEIRREKTAVIHTFTFGFASDHDAVIHALHCRHSQLLDLRHAAAIYTLLCEYINQC